MTDIVKALREIIRDDIVKALRENAVYWTGTTGDKRDLMNEAADEIERLRVDADIAFRAKHWREIVRSANISTDETLEPK